MNKYRLMLWYYGPPYFSWSWEIYNSKEEAEKAAERIMDDINNRRTFIRKVAVSGWEL